MQVLNAAESRQMQLRLMRSLKRHCWLVPRLLGSKGWGECIPQGSSVGESLEKALAPHSPCGESSTPEAAQGSQRAGAPNPIKPSSCCRA